MMFTLSHRLVFVTVLSMLSASLLAQDPAAAQREEMKKLNWLIGDWQGSGWVQMGPQGRNEFTQSEHIESKLEGLVLLIEGHGKDRETGSSVHDALAFISYDQRGQEYRWRSFTAEGRGTDTNAIVTTNSLQWGMQIPGRGQMRYTLKLNEKGEWFEVGEMSRDGQTWRQFFEMTLQRKP